MKKSPLFISILGFLFLFGGISLLTSGCDSTPSSSSNTITNDEEEDSEENNTLVERGDTNSNMRSRGLDMSTARVAGFSFQASFPLLFDIVKEDSYLLSDMESYAKKIMVAGEVNTEKDFFGLLVQRDSSILPHLEAPVVAFLDNVYDSDQNTFTSALNELKKLGISINMAEGMVTGLSTAPMLENKVKEINSANLTAFLNFQNAKSESMSGEYPFGDMKPYETMIISGETLIENQPNPYFELIEKDFYYALESFTDIHMVSDPSARQNGSGVPTVGGVHTSAYPYMAEVETMQEFAQNNPNSKYGQAVARIAENMSEISPKPENIYIIITEWVDELSSARRTVARHLAKGEDIPHYLEITRGDGKSYYAIAYRFYDDGEKAAEALDKVQSKYPNAKMIMASVKGEKLYQLGPSN